MEKGSLEGYPHDTTVVYDPSLWRMRLCQKTLCQMALQGKLGNVVKHTSVFVAGLGHGQH